MKPHKILIGQLELWAQAYKQYSRPLRRCLREIERTYSDGQSFTARRAQILSAIHAGSWKLTEIVERTQIPKPSALRVLRKLCEEGTIKKVPIVRDRKHGGDRKSVLYQIRE